MQKFKFNHSLTFERFGNRTLIFNPANESIITVNSAMMRIIYLIKKLLPQTFTQKQLKALLHKQYRLSLYEIEQQCKTLLNEWSRYGIVEK